MNVNDEVERTRLERVFKEKGFKGDVFDKKSKKHTFTRKARLFFKSKVDEGSDINNLVPKGMVYNAEEKTLIKLKDVVDSKGRLKKRFKKKKGTSILEKRKKKTRAFSTKKSNITYRFTISGVNKDGKHFTRRDTKEGSMVFSTDVEGWKSKLRKTVSDMENSKEPSLTIYIKEENFKIVSSVKIPFSGFRLDSMRMKRVELVLDGDTEHTWDTRSNKCVLDFLEYYYEKETKDRKISIDSFNTDYLDLVFEEGWLEEGISPIELKNWCKLENIKMLCLDKDEQIICMYEPETKSHLKSLIYKIHNEHIHPIINKTKINSLVQSLGKGVGRAVPKKENGEKGENGEKEEIVIVNCIEGNIEYLCRKMIETGTEVLNNNIIFSDSRLISFKLLNKKYIFPNSQALVVEKWCKKNDIKFKGQLPSNFVNEYFDKYNMRFSHPNSIIDKLFSTEGIKNRCHVDGKLTSFGKKDFDKGLEIFDIKSSHLNIMNYPSEKWMFFEFKDNFVKFKEENIPLGLYYVETDDNLLFFNNNIYSSAIVKKGLKEKIITFDNIKYVMKSTISEEKDYMRKLLESYDEMGELKKMMYCNTSGLLGKTKKKIRKMHLTTSQEEAFSYLIENDEKKQTFSMDYKFDDKCFTFYGENRKQTLDKTNFPLYIQILDQQSIRLFNCMKEIGGDLKFRRSDSLWVIRDNVRDQDKGKIPKCMVNKTNEHKELSKEQDIDLPQNIHHNIKVNWKEIIKEGSWVLNENIKFSTDAYLQIIEMIEKNQSIRVEGGAGLGKSYTIKKIVENYKPEEYMLCAFTNTAANNIGGKTLHSSLNLNNGKIPPSTINKLKKTLKFVIVDEHSMIPGFLWQTLETLKKEIGCSILIFGDFNQLAPVDTGDYKQHYIVKEICDYNYCKLEHHDLCRFDKDLRFFVDECKGEYRNNMVKKLPIFKKNKDNNINFHICYTNKKVVELNKNEMDKIKQEDKLFDLTITQQEECDFLNFTDDEKASFQDLIIGKGTPVISRKTIKDLNIYKNKFYKVVGMDKNGNNASEQFKLTTICMVDSSGQKLDISLINFIKNFSPAYAITCHKAQGMTIQQKYVIHEINYLFVDNKWLYTALSRSSKLEYIYISP